MSRFLVASLLALTFAPGAAHAVAHHSDVVVQKLRDAKTQKVIGARIHMIADPEDYDHIRVNLGKMKIDPTTKQQPGYNHRQMAAGFQPGYVRAQALDVQNIPKKANSSHHELQELKMDVVYGQGNDLKPGDKVDIYTVYNGQKASMGSSHWHVYGMQDGPMTTNDTTHVHEMPSDTSTHGEATELAP